MAQVNNNAESLSRELRKFKNLKSVDFKGLLSGTPESYVNLYRYLFCENNIGFSQLVLDKGYDLSGLNDYKFMEAVYRMMRDFLNTKPPINQNQFFSPGFTQRKLEMSTVIAAEVRKITNELSNKNGKKTVQTPGLMKLSLKRPNSAPKQTRVIEMGENDSENAKHKIPIEKFKKTKSANRYMDKNTSDKPKRVLTHHNNSHSSDELSDESEEVDSYNSQTRANGYGSGHNYEARSKNIVERSDMSDGYNSQFRTNEPPPKTNFDSRSKSIMDTQKYSSTFNHQKPIELGDISAFETTHSDKAYNTRNNHQERLYDVKQYAPTSYNEPLAADTDQRMPGLEKIMQQFDTVLARITLLEGRMNRIESKLDNTSSNALDRQTTPSIYTNQGNVNNSEYISSYEHNNVIKNNSYCNKNGNVIKGSRDAIPDFESNHQPLRAKIDSDRSYTSSTYSSNYKPIVSNDNNYTVPRYSTNFTNYSEKRGQDLQNTNGTNVDYYPLSATYNSSSQGLQGLSNSMAPAEHYHPMASTYKASQPPQKISNGIPPVHPPVKKFDDLGHRDHRYGKQNDEKVLSQTDRIASMLSDTQKMLRLSDEEL